MNPRTGLDTRLEQSTQMEQQRQAEGGEDTPGATESTGLGIVQVLMTGLYGWLAADFVAMLRRHQPLVVIDTRYRAETRSPDRAWLGSQSLKMMVELLGARYVHLQSVAPSQQMVDRLSVARQASSTKGPRQNTFNQPMPGWYEEMYLQRLDQGTLETLGRLIGAGPALVLGVQAEASLCHRSLLGSALMAEGYQVEQIRSQQEPVAETMPQRLHRLERMLAQEREATVSLLHSILDTTRRDAVSGLIEVEQLPMGRVQAGLRVLEQRMA